MRNLNYPYILCLVLALSIVMLVIDDEPTGEASNFNATLTEVRHAAPNESIACQYAATMTLTYRYSELTDYKAADLECAREVVRAITTE